MKILQLSLKPPYPKVDGGCVAIAAMTEGLLSQGHDVKLLTMETRKHPFMAEKVPADVLRSTSMEAVRMNTEIRIGNALLNLFTSESYNIQRFRSTAFESKLIDMLQRNTFDIIHLESIFCTPYLPTIRKHSSAKVVVRTHNVEHNIWRTLARQESVPFKKWYLDLLSNRLKTYETAILNQVDGIVPITHEDMLDFEKLGIRVPMYVCPVGIDIQSIGPAQLQTDKLHLYHLGAMDWEPNVEAVRWFIHEIWPAVHAALPEVECTLAGRRMPDDLIACSSAGLNIQGEVADAAQFMADKNVAIVPLRSGSGIRVKILEALAAGKVVISTSIGATGIPFSEGESMMIADDASAFVTKLKHLSNNPEHIRSMGSEARKLAEQHFDLKRLSEELTYFYRKL